MGISIPVISQKKKQGVFYTPRNVAEIICDWAIWERKNLVLEPSFGGCDFLEASRGKLSRLGASEKNIKKQLFGCDIDPQAFMHLKKIVSHPNGHFIKSDFLKVMPGLFPKTADFDVVVGNPPYVSHHNMDDEQLQSAIQAIKKDEYKLDGRASLWAYFVLHSLQFVKENGRMAWILPSSFLYAGYSKTIHEVIKGHFSRSLIIQLGERLFVRDGTEEISVVTLCEDYHSNQDQNGILKFIFASSVKELKEEIEQWTIEEQSSAQNTNDPAQRLLSGDSLSIYESLANSSESKSLGEMCDIQIGIVSGANSFFILNATQWETNGLSDDVLSFVLTRFHYAKGIKLLKNDLLEFKKSGYPCLLVDTSKVDIVSGSVKAYLDSFPKDKIEKITTFVRRSRSGVWHKFNDDHIPDAFFPYMHNEGPSLVLNTARINSTNSIHRIYFNKNIDNTQKKIIAISINSTFSQLSAEIVGRIYGAGVLKHEPSEAAKIKLLVPVGIDQLKVKSVFLKIDELMRSGKKDEARKQADEFVLQGLNADISRHYQEILAEALIRTRERRFPPKNN